MTATELFLSLLRAEITGTPVTLPEDFDDCFRDVMATAKSQDMEHLAFHALKRSGWRPKDLGPWQKAEQGMLREIYRATGNEYLLKTTREILTEARIPHVPLKGAVIREWYPEPWMRASCDTDLLVREEDLDRAVAALTKGGFTTDGVKGAHDVSLYLQGAHLELHFSIRENLPSVDGLLDEVWDRLEQTDEFGYRETPAFFAFHLIAHALYHFQKTSGCGVKPFLDLWILRRTRAYEESELRSMLERCGATKFYEAMLETVSVWFEGKAPTELTEMIRRYVFRGGAYGSFRNEAAMEIRKEGRFRYLTRILFPPRGDMERQYPELRSRSALLPVCYVRRLWSKLTGRDRKKAGGKLRTILTEDPTAAGETEELFTRLGLN